VDRNYITPSGAKRLSDELKRLIEIERPKTVDEVATAAAHGDRSENAEYKYGKLRLREIDRRIRFLQKRLDAAVVVAPEAQDSDKVFFGASVEVEDADGARKRYQLVGEDESAPSEGRISWRSPIGRALLKRTVGDVVTVKRPAGEIELEIVAISYE
jgi:transcription elongation factor GreB